MINLREFNYVPIRYQEGEFSFTVSIPRLTLSEGYYSIGAYVVTDDFDGDLLEVVEIAVAAKRFRQDFAPYAASARGFVWLDAKGIASEAGNQIVKATNDD